MPEALVYVVKREINFHIPFREQAITYSPKSFAGSRHVIRARLALPEEIAPGGIWPSTAMTSMATPVLSPRQRQRRNARRGGVCRPQRHRRHF